MKLPSHQPIGQVAPTNEGAVKRIGCWGHPHLGEMREGHRRGGPPRQPVHPYARFEGQQTRLPQRNGPRPGAVW
jgi:hypothetical protein